MPATATATKPLTFPELKAAAEKLSKLFSATNRQPMKDFMAQYSQAEQDRIILRMRELWASGK